MSMMLSQVKKGRLKRPEFIVIHGPPGVGKTTFAADAPNPIFLGAEDGSAQHDVARLPTPKSWADVRQAIHELTTEKHDFATLVVDSLDWLEPLVWDEVVANDKKGAENIEEVGGGFFKGYVLAADKVWRPWIRSLEALRAKRGMNLILIAHSKVKPFNDPRLNVTYDRFSMKIDERAAALFYEAAEAVLFATYEVATKGDGNKGKVKAFGDGTRVLFTERRPGFDAKNRTSLPFQLPLSWEDYIRAANAGQPEDPEEVLEQIRGLMKNVTDPEKLKLINSSIEKAGMNAVNLLKVHNRLMTLVNTPSAPQSRTA